MCEGGRLFVYWPGSKNMFICVCVWLCITCTYLSQVSGCGSDCFSVRGQRAEGTAVKRGGGGSVMKLPFGE